MNIYMYIWYVYGYHEPKFQKHKIREHSPVPITQLLAQTQYCYGIRSLVSMFGYHYEVHRSLVANNMIPLNYRQWHDGNMVKSLVLGASKNWCVYKPICHILRMRVQLGGAPSNLRTIVSTRDYGREWIWQYRYISVDNVCTVCETFR